MTTISRSDLLRIRSRKWKSGLDWDEVQAAGLPWRHPYPRCVARVTPESPYRDRRRAADLALAAMNEMSYGPMYWGSGVEEQEDGTTAFVAFSDGRAVGLLILEPRENPPRVRFAWTAEHYRGQGFSGDLVRAAARYVGMAPTELGWLAPFTDAGARLASRFGAEIGPYDTADKWRYRTLARGVRQ